MSVEEKPKSLRKRNYERTRQRILAAALDLFTAEGYDLATMDAIAERAEVGRATLFKYFPTKSALLIPLSQQILFAELRPQIEELLTQELTTVEVLYCYFELIGKRIEALSDVTRALLKTMDMTDERVSEQVPDFAATLSIIIKYGQDREGMRRDIPLDVLTKYISVLYGTVVKQVMRTGELDTYYGLVRQLVAFVSMGLRS